MDKQRPPSTRSQATVFRDLRARNERHDRVAKLLEAQRRRRIERAIEAQLERWTRQK
ncbi:MAG: hypothetical protein ACLQA5_14470 [Solirubrobacteraceae bacterium]